MKAVKCIFGRQSSYQICAPFLDVQICVCSHENNAFFYTKTYVFIPDFFCMDRQVKCLVDGEKKSKKYSSVCDLFDCKVLQTRFFCNFFALNQLAFPQ